MSTDRRTQPERTAATRAALVGAARNLFAEHGYAAIGTERIVKAAGLTRGALYHQFADKSDLFAAVLEAVEADIVARIADVIATVPPDETADVLAAGAEAWLDVCAEPGVQRIVLIDGPAVLGWERWREIGMQHGFGLVSGVLAEAMQSGRIPSQPVEPLTHVLVGALDEAALYVARADDQTAARAEMASVVQRLVRAVTGV
jgi:AcrR family transcriptional regulator